MSPCASDLAWVRYGSEAPDCGSLLTSFGERLSTVERATESSGKLGVDLLHHWIWVKRRAVDSARIIDWPPAPAGVDVPGY